MRKVIEKPGYFIEEMIRILKKKTTPQEVGYVLSHLEEPAKVRHMEKEKFKAVLWNLRSWTV